jgi:hypothetical protein
MAPEQLAGVRVTAAADMWSWAVTIAFTGTGELPFRGESLTATAYAILHSEPAVGALREPLGSLVYRCLNKDPAARPSARDALDELAAAGARLVGPLPPTAPPLPKDEGAPRSPGATAAVPELRHDTGNGLIGAWPAAVERSTGVEEPVAAGAEEPAALERSAGAEQPAPAQQPAGTELPAAAQKPASTEQPAAMQQSARRGIGRARWRRRPAAVLASILLVAGVTGTALVLARHGAPPGGHADRGQQPGTGQQSGPGKQLPAAAAARAQAVSWIVREVTHAEVVGCDPQVCTDLTKQGFPAGNLLTFTPQSNDPTGAGLVVVTPAIQAQWGNRLASVYAPAVIASFGSGKAKIDVRLVPPGGAKGYRATQQADLRARRTADALLLTNSRIEFSATARRQLLSGDIDPRLPMLLAVMAHGHPMRIVDFGGWSPGGGPASLLRWVDVATVNTGAHLTRVAYVRWLRSFVNVQRAQFLPPPSQQVTSSTGQAVLRIEYLAPSPLSPP